MPSKGIRTKVALTPDLEREKKRRQLDKTISNMKDLYLAALLKKFSRALAERTMNLSTSSNVRTITRHKDCGQLLYLQLCWLT